VRRTVLVLVLTATAALTGLVASNPASGGEGEEVAFLNITKVVDGDGPTGGYVIEYSCTFDDKSAPEGGGGTGGSLAFDQAGPGNPETQQIVLGDPGTCTVTETDSNGADSVTYECAFVGGDVDESPDGAFAEGREGGCIDDQSGQIANVNDELSITVTNAFEADVLPDDVDPPPAVEPDVVSGSPSFTG
jgi:hypothetical protein